MSFSVFLFALIVLVPSLILATTLRLKRVPLRLSWTQPSLPIQLFFLGIAIPMPSYIVASFAVGHFFPISAGQLLLYLVGVHTPNGSFQLNLLGWSAFFVAYYFLCLATGWLLGSFFHASDRILDFFERHSMVDEDVYAKALLNKVSVEVDVLTSCGEFVYAGKLERSISEVYFLQGSIVLRDVLKIPASEANIPIEEYKGMLLSMGKLNSRSFLRKMVFPKQNIVNLNLRIKERKTHVNSRFKN